MDQFVNKETKECIERVNHDCLLDQPPSDFTPQDDEHLLNTLANEIAAKYPDILDSYQLPNTSDSFNMNVELSYQEREGSELHSVSNSFDSGNILNEEFFLNSSELSGTQMDLMDSYSTSINHVSPIYLQDNQEVQGLCNLSKESISNSSKGFALNNSITDFTIFDGKDASFPHDLLAVQSTSGLHGNIHSSNELGEIFHSKYRQPRNETNSCSFCKKGINKHNVVHEGKKIYKCCICRYRSDRKHDLLRHMNRYGSDHFSCNMCEKIVRGTGGHDKELTCSFCNEKFSCLTSYENHFCIKNIYAFCRKCRQAIYDHIFEHEGEKYFHCCRCSFTSKTSDNLHRHLDSHRDGNFICEVCNKGSRWKKNYRSIQENTQTNFRLNVKHVWLGFLPANI